MTVMQKKSFCSRREEIDSLTNECVIKPGLHHYIPFTSSKLTDLITIYQVNLSTIKHYREM